MDEYYVQQAGSGIGGFAGVRYQKGDGFFGRMLSGTVLPIIKKVLPYIGRTLMGTAGDIVYDVSQGEKVRDSFSRRMKETGRRIEEDAMAKVRKMTGSGRRKRKAKPKAAKKRKTVSKCRTAKRRSRKPVAYDFL